MDDHIFEYFSTTARTRPVYELDEPNIGYFPGGVSNKKSLAMLLSYVLPPSENPDDCALKLLERFGSLGAVIAADPQRLKEMDFLNRRSIGFLKSVFNLHLSALKEEIMERPVIGSWTALLDYLAAAMQHEAAEHFRLLFLDRKNILIRDEVQSQGTVDHTPLYPREVVKRALELAASAIIMVHNHPSGDPTPSQADIDMTRQVVTALNQVNIQVHDHIIVGKNRHTSFKTQQYL
jgi:DNA repair protein RadC